MYENIFEMYQATPFALGFLASLFVTGVCICIFIFSNILTWCWYWCDDYEEFTPNPLLIKCWKIFNPNKGKWYSVDQIINGTSDDLIKFRKMERVTGKSHLIWKYYIIDKDGILVDRFDNIDELVSTYLSISIVLSLLPFLIIVFLQFFTISLIIALFCAFVFGCRFIRRLQKKVCAHIENLEIHNKPKDEDKS